MTSIPVDEYPVRTMAAIDFSSYRVLTFDCYGTLIDWESGILGALEPILARHGIRLDEEKLLGLYADLESQIQEGPFLLYRDVLREVVRIAGETLAIEPLPGEVDALVASLPGWRPFADTVPALEELKKRYRLAVISNVDRDLFEHSARRLAVAFDWIVTADAVGSYKPARANFEYAIEMMKVPREKILHVAQSIYHDIIPAGQLGLSTVWVNRRGGRRGSGATRPAAARPDIEVPDLRGLVDLIAAG